MTLLLLFFSILAGADDFSTERYCFQGPELAAKGQGRFQQIKVPSDRDSLEGACLVVVMRPHRRELIQKYLLSLYPDLQIVFSSAEASREPCRLRIEKYRSKTNATVGGGLTENGASVSATQQVGSANDVVNVETLGAFEFSLNNYMAKGSCQYITPKQYRIVLELRKTPRQVIFTGTEQAREELPVEQGLGLIKTELQLGVGQKVNVADLLKENNANAKALDLKDGASIQTTQGAEEESVFLMLQP